MTSPSLAYERELWRQGFKIVAGIDEVGRGAWAGPLIAAAVVLHASSHLQSESISTSSSPVLSPMLRDSKKLSASQRENVVKEIKKLATCWGIGAVSVEEINEVGVGKANELAMKRAIMSLPTLPEFILIDGNMPLSEYEGQQKVVVGGDGSIASISAASILAKVHRDKLMVELGAAYPQYHFDKHKGYGTKLHQQAIIDHGLSPMHRSNYRLKFLQK